MKNLKLIMAIILLIPTLLFLGCSNTQKPVQKETIKIGWVGALTGDQAAWGQCELNTIKMLFENINNNGGVLGRNLEVIGYDTKGDPNETVSGVKRLVEKEKVLVILGPNSSNSAIPISSVLESAKVPGIATVATNPRVTEENGKVKPYSFRVCFVDSYQGNVAATYAREVLKLNTAAILYDSSDEYSTDLASFFEESFTQKGGQIVAKEAFKAGDIDFTPQLKRIKETSPEVIFMPYFHDEVGYSTKQARELGIRSIFMGGDGWPSDELYREYKKYIEGSYIVNHLNTNDPEVQELKRLYKEKYNTNIELNGYMVHDAVLAMVKAIETAGELSSEKITKALEGIDVKGITGRIKIGKDTHNPEGKEAAIIKIVDGKEVFVQKFAAD
ncbi:MAG: ABC transporter substrate-binding protein [Bacillota bacterium]